MQGSIVLSRREAAQFFDVSENGITDIARAHDLKPKRMRGAPAKGLDLDDLAIIAKALGKPAPTEDDLRRQLAFA